MKPLILTAKEENTEERLPPSIVATTMQGKYFCTIQADGTISFNPEFEYTVDELDQVRLVEKLFFTVYNSLIEKEKTIDHLGAKNKALMKELMFSLNPIIERQ